MAASEVVIGSALYSEVHASVERFAASAGGEPGDPQKLAKRIVELVQRPGKLPSRFALGVSVQAVVRYDVSLFFIDERVMLLHSLATSFRND